MSYRITSEVKINPFYSYRAKDRTEICREIYEMVQGKEEYILVDFDGIKARISPYSTPEDIEKELNRPLYNRLYSSAEIRDGLRSLFFILIIYALPSTNDYVDTFLFVAGYFCLFNASYGAMGMLVRIFITFSEWAIGIAYGIRFLSVACVMSKD